MVKLLYSKCHPFVIRTNFSHPEKYLSGCRILELVWFERRLQIAASTFVCVCVWERDLALSSLEILLGIRSVRGSWQVGQQFGLTFDHWYSIGNRHAHARTHADIKPRKSVGINVVTRMKGRRIQYHRECKQESTLKGNADIRDVFRHGRQKRTVIVWGTNRTRSFEKN